MLKLRKPPTPMKLRPPPKPKSRWGSPVEIERKRRINVAVWAYAYEFLNTSLVSDEDFDQECQLVNVSMATGNIRHDAFFRRHFKPDTGLWVHQHPNKARLRELAMRKMELLGL